MMLSDVWALNNQTKIYKVYKVYLRDSNILDIGGIWTAKKIPKNAFLAHNSLIGRLYGSSQYDLTPFPI